MALILGTIFAGLIAVIALWLVVRFYIIPPLEADLNAAGLQIDIHRSDLRNVSISVDGSPWINLGNISSSSTLTWQTLGVSGPTPTVQNILIVGQTGSRWFETQMSFGQMNLSANLSAENMTQTWRYIDPAQAEQLKAGGPSQFTAAPEGP